MANALTKRITGTPAGGTTARVAMSVPVANALIACCQTLGAAMQLNAAAPGAEAGGQRN